MLHLASCQREWDTQSTIPTTTWAATLRRAPTAIVYEMASPGRMTTEIFREFHSPDIPEAVLVQAAELFSDHYGIWNTPAGRPGGKPGTVFFTILWISYGLGLLI